jgi:endonuclease YncB( thermonuclease family)
MVGRSRPSWGRLTAATSQSGQGVERRQIQPRGSVVDGDTLELMDAKCIRLWGSDAPEGAQTCQPAGRPWRCGDHATEPLSS